MGSFVIESNRSYIIQISDDDGGSRGSYRIDQYVDPTQGAKAQERVRNQVEKHMFHQWRKTGLTHHVVFEGSPDAAKNIILVRDSLPF